MNTRPSQSTFDGFNLDRAIETAAACVRWAVESFGSEVCLLSSMQDSTLIDIAMRIHPRIDVVFLDNGYHFRETIETVARVERQYGITVRRVGPIEDVQADIAAGECCDTKTALLEQALDKKRAWISGLRRTETATRAKSQLVETDRRGLTKINPLASWTDDDVNAYRDANDVLLNPLLLNGYTSVGCEPCTSRPSDMDERSGRWQGSERSECGLHL
jgi:phosphoadenosine phosphosulfate reductase